MSAEDETKVLAPATDGPFEHRITCKQRAGYYVRSCKSFLYGQPAKEAVGDKEAVPAREAKDIIIVSALGDAIPIAGEVVARLQAEGDAEILKVETDYPAVPGRKIESQVAQLRVTIKACPDVLPAVSEEGYHEKMIKNVKKEGGKKGSELAGAADMGGIEYFSTQVETPQGDPRLLEIVNQEMNQEVDPAEEETKGGSGRVAKCLLSASDKQLAILTYVPKDKTGIITADEWMNSIIKAFGGYGEIVTTVDKRKCVATFAQDGAAGKFPIKLRDEGIAASVAFLKSKGLFPDKDDDSDDYMVFGDDDFPG